MGVQVVEAPASAQIECPECDKTGTVRGIKHHFTTVHNDGVSGGLLVSLLVVQTAKL